MRPKLGHVSLRILEKFHPVLVNGLNTTSLIRAHRACLTSSLLGLLTLRI